MLRYKIFSCTCTDTWCYINRPSLVFAQALEVTRSSLVLAQTLDAALHGAGLPGKGGRGRRGVAGLGDQTIRGGGTGPRTGTIYLDLEHRNGIRLPKLQQIS